MTKTIYNPVTPLQFCLFCSAFQLSEGYFTFKTLWLEVEWFESLQDKIMSSQVCWKEALHGQGLRWSDIIMVVPLLRKVTFIVEAAFVFAPPTVVTCLNTTYHLQSAISDYHCKEKGRFWFSAHFEQWSTNLLFLVSCNLQQNTRNKISLEKFHINFLRLSGGLELMRWSH